MNAGELCHRIRIEKKTQGRDEDGNFLESSWQTHATLWANFKPLSVKDIISSQANGETTSAMCKLRWSNTTKQIDTTMRLIFDGKIYSIDGPPLRDNINGKIYCNLMLSSGIEN